MHNMEEASTLDVEVAVIGAGPSGLVATALLARDHRVALIERQPARYSLPRAGHVDHEVMRILQGLDAHRPLLADQAPCDHYRWVNGDRQTLLSFEYGAPSVSGFQHDLMMYQPVLEDGVYAAIEGAAREPVIAMGREMVAIEEEGDRAVVTARRRDGATTDGPAEEMRVRARYVLAADGARSPSRGLLGIGRRDFDFSERWLVLDVRILEPLPAELLALEAFQVCDPRRPTLLAPLGKRHFRFEWMLFEEDDAAEFESPQKGWDLLAEWDVLPGQVEFARQVVYSFEAKVAERWRRGRVLLVGDAVHTMPPHMGQGMCSGVRDAANVAWKLDLVLRGAAEERLLDSYEEERRPHSEAWIGISKQVGEISCMTDPVAAARRDAALLSGEEPPVPDFPHLEAGVLRANGEEGGPRPPAGELFLQAEVERDGCRGLFHDIVGQGFHLVGRLDDPIALLGERERRVLAALDATVSVLGAGGAEGFGDPDGSYAAYFGDRAAVVVRPDYVVYGAAATAADLPGLIDDLGRDLELTGLEPGA